MKKSYYAINQVEKGTVIYDVDEPIDSICLILKGRVLAINEGTKIYMGSGSFLGISDLYIERYLNSYVAYDDVTLYCFPITKPESLTEIFNSNKDYIGLTVLSMAKYLNEVNNIHSSLKQNTLYLYDFNQIKYNTYVDTCKRLGYQADNILNLGDIESYEVETMADERKLLFLTECSKTPLDAWKSFCVNETVAMYFIEEIAGLIAGLSLECIEYTSYIADLFNFMMNDSNMCLYKSFAALAINIEEMGGYNNEILSAIDEIIDQMNTIEKLLLEKTGKVINTHRDKMEEIYYLVLSNNNVRKEQVEQNFQYSQNEVEKVDEELKNSMKQIITYGNFEDERGTRLELLVNDFMNLKDKYSIDDSVRSLRKKIAELFYELYEAVFLRAYEEKEVPRVIDLFLKYGFLDERLLSKEQLRELYFLGEEIDSNDPCKIYNIKEWLIQIYNGNKEPSKNEFDLDYNDKLREMKKRGEITEEEEKSLKVNNKNKVSYEIKNMFRCNHRLVSGKISTFIPFLWNGNIIGKLKNIYLSNEKINTVIKELVEIDYSVFHREVMYVNNEKGITREYIMKQIFPDIIIMPCVGYNGVMWQDITGKIKNSEGRFILPTFSEVAVKEIMIKVLGRYRWELCRTIQGTAWNNLKYKSLTSEYTDYIQFYKKNRDLSEDAKNKLKAQIQRGKGNMREIFTLDYEAWIKGESNGLLRLNKVAREIFATYCPFNKSIREKLQGQPLILDAMARFNRGILLKVKELDNRYRSLERDGIEVTEELLSTYKFYKDM